MNEKYDIVVLGGGIGGYTAAIRAVQLGKKVAIVEKGELGGTCLHRGCIPSKALLKSAELYAAMKDSERFGIEAEAIGLNFLKVQERKREVVEQLHKGLEFLMRKNKIDIVRGLGRIIGPSIFSPKSGSVAVEREDGEIDTLLCDYLIIATGSRPQSLPGLHIDGKVVMTSDEALGMERLPQSMIIVGGGAIGIEWASLLSDFGVEVTIVEAQPQLVPAEDADIAKELARVLRKRKVNVLTDTAVLIETVKSDETGVTLDVQLKGRTQTLQAERMLVCVGRKANVEQIGLENTGVKLERGCIKVSSAMQTEESHIYAVGDVVGGVMLAHAAAHEGKIAVEHIAVMKVEPTSAHLVPRCIYSRPQIASVGFTERGAAEAGYETKTGKFPFRALGKAQIGGELDGFVKVVADVATNDLLGVHIIGAHATEYIAEAALAQLLNASAWEVGQTIRPHPTLSEALGEAMLEIDGLSLQI
jgi:dihydrolipoamide dehydrogenase